MRRWRRWHATRLGDFGEWLIRRGYQLQAWGNYYLNREWCLKEAAKKGIGR